MEARFFEREGTDGQGEVIEFMEGEVLTRREKVIVRMERLCPPGGNVNAKEPSHRIKVKAVYGEYIDSGAAWTKTGKQTGNLYLSVTMSDPQVSFALFPDEEAEGEWKADASAFRGAA